LVRFEAGIEPSVGSTGDSYDNALAESVIGLFKAEEIYRRGSWKGLEDVEFATLEWVAWYNGSRLLEPLGYVPPAEFEKAYHDRQAAPVGMAVLTLRALRETRGGAARCWRWPW
jgi:putative transposase